MCTPPACMQQQAAAAAWHGIPRAHACVRVRRCAGTCMRSATAQCIKDLHLASICVQHACWHWQCHVRPKHLSLRWLPLRPTLVRRLLPRLRRHPLSEIGGCAAGGWPHLLSTADCYYCVGCWSWMPAPAPALTSCCCSMHPQAKWRAPKTAAVATLRLAPGSCLRAATAWTAGTPRRPLELPPGKSAVYGAAVL